MGNRRIVYHDDNLFVLRFLSRPFDGERETTQDEIDAMLLEEYKVVPTNTIPFLASQEGSYWRRGSPLYWVLFRGRWYVSQSGEARLRSTFKSYPRPGVCDPGEKAAALLKQLSPQFLSGFAHESLRYHYWIRELARINRSARYDRNRMLRGEW